MGLGLGRIYKMISGAKFKMGSQFARKGIEPDLSARLGARWTFELSL